MIKKRIVRLFFVVTLALLLLPSSVQAVDVNDFKIKSFDADFYLSRDDNRVSNLRVEEELVAEFPDYNQNHGILRAIPKSYQGHSVSLSVDSVTDELGGRLNYTTYEEGGNLVLKIGDADTYVHGLKTYEISYSLKNVTLNLDEQDEFYWDVNGDQWEQTFEEVSARIHMTEDLYSEVKDKICFTGSYGSSESSCEFFQGSKSGELVVSATRVLDPGETLTFDIAFEKDTFAAYKMSTDEIIGLLMFALLIIGPIALSLFIAIRNWLRNGRDPKGKSVVVPQYLTPKEVSVLSSGVVVKERFEGAFLSAQIIDLAVRHFLKIYEIKEKKVFGEKTTYEIELVGDANKLRKEEIEVVKALFGSGFKIGDRKKLSDLANKLYKEARDIGKMIGKGLTDSGYFRVEPRKARRPYTIAGIAFLVIGFIFVPFTLGFVVAGVIMLIASNAMPARTAKGVELRDYLLGLCDYMKLAEKERLKILQSPHGSLTEKVNVDDKKQLVKLYEKLLPYAMLFGIEKDWAKEFAELYTEQPDWYVGSGAFRSAVFISSLNDFNRATANSFASSNSSSSSGFGGGGFSGGGGGGGGGGGW